MYKNERYVVLCLVFATGCVSSISMERTKDAPATTGSGTNCNTWSPWVNDNHPSSSNITDKEFVPLRTRAAFCPIAVGGNISKFECKDDKGEPFHGNRTLRGLGDQFFVMCYDINVGVECIALNATRGHCPDLSMRYYCSCPKSTSISDIPNSTPSKGAVNTTVIVNGTNSKEGVPLLWLMLVPVLASLLFLFNTGFAICLYKKVLKTIQEKEKRTTVHPL